MFETGKLTLIISNIYMYTDGKQGWPSGESNLSLTTVVRGSICRPITLCELIW